MTATDELRRLLDERGVEWGAEESELDHVTAWNANGGQAMFYESKTTNPNLLQVNYYHLTPEQAVEATLGSDLQAENAKLRELVRNVEHYEQLGCRDCPHGRSCNVCTLYDEDCAMSREIEREKRELGIEVDA